MFEDLKLRFGGYNWGVDWQIDWVYDSTYEAARLVHAASNTARGFYSKKGFWVVPRLIDDVRCVYLPRLKFEEIESFWERVARIDPQWLIKDPKVEIVFEMESLILQKGCLFSDSRGTRAALARMTREWELIDDEFRNSLEEVLPQVKDMKLNVHILPTEFGTASSFLSWKDGDRHQVRIWWRMDTDLGHLAEGIISALWAVPLRKKRQYSWEESEAIIDFLMTKTTLREMFPDYEMTLQNLRKKEHAALAIEAQEYLQSLGLVKSYDVQVLGEDIYFAGTKMDLSFTEKKILKLLCKHRGTLVSFVQLESEVWAERDEGFSLWSIAQYMYQIRLKLEALGGGRHMIQSRRKLGYVLV